MTTIGILSSDNSSSLSKCLSAGLCCIQEGHILVNETGIYNIGEQKEIFLFQSSNVSNICSTNPDIIILDNYYTPSSFNFTMQNQLTGISIVKSHNKNDIQCALNFNLNIITCGTGTTDSVSISSVKDNTLIISIMRSFWDIHGNEIVPQDILLNIHPSYYDDEYYLSCAACFLLLGYSPEILRNIW